MAYLYAVEDYSLDAVNRSCRLFMKGKVPDRNNAFAPSAPELAAQCELAEGVLKVEAYEAARIFIECDSDLWRKMEIAKDDCHLVSCTRHGKRGWFFLPEEVAEAQHALLPPPVSDAQRVANVARLGLVLSTFNAADDDQHDMGQRK